MKSKLIFILLAYLIFLFIFAFVIPAVWGQFDGEHRLVEIPPHPMFEGWKCGTYFVLVSDEEERFKIGFIFEIELWGEENNAFFPEEFVIIFDNKKIIPTVKFITGKNGTKVMLKISEGDFKKSPCLKRCFDSNRT